MNHTCGLCGCWITLLPGAVMAGHGMFLSVAIDRLAPPRNDVGFVAGVCSTCLRSADAVAVFFQRERLARGGGDG